MGKREKINHKAKKQRMNDKLSNCGELFYDEENDEWVTWEYLDKVRALRKKHRRYYKNNKAIEKSYANSMGSIKKRSEDA